MSPELNDSARNILRLAAEFARESGSESVETEHLLLALLTDADAAVVAMLAVGSSRNGTTVIDRILSALRRDMPEPGESVPRGKIPLSPIAQQAIAFAEAEIERAGAGIVEPPHLLLGLLLERRGLAFRVLEELGFTADALRTQIESDTDRQTPEPAPMPINGSHAGLVDRLIEFESGLTYRERRDDGRVYIPRNDGWQAQIKRGWEKLYCYLKHPGDEAFHLILNGEVYLQRGDEKYCLDCALRHEFATRNRLYWQRLKREKQTD